MSDRWRIVDHLNKHQGQRFCSIGLAEALNLSEATVRRELPGLCREGLIDREINPKFTNLRSRDGQPRHHYLIHL